MAKRKTMVSRFRQSDGAVAIIPARRAAPRAGCDRKAHPLARPRSVASNRTHGRATTSQPLVPRTLAGCSTGAFRRRYHSNAPAAAAIIHPASRTCCTIAALRGPRSSRATDCCMIPAAPSGRNRKADIRLRPRRTRRYATVCFLVQSACRAARASVSVAGRSIRIDPNRRRTGRAEQPRRPRRRDVCRTPDPRRFAIEIRGRPAPAGGSRRAGRCTRPRFPPDAPVRARFLPTSGSPGPRLPRRGVWWLPR
jgi:hypothetical protein